MNRITVESSSSSSNAELNFKIRTYLRQISLESESQQEPSVFVLSLKSAFEKKTEFATGQTDSSD